MTRFVVVACATSICINKFDIPSFFNWNSAASYVKKIRVPHTLFTTHQALFQLQNITEQKVHISSLFTLSMALDIRALQDAVAELIRTAKDCHQSMEKCTENTHQP